MRISDWSSDVCSSDLRRPGGLTPPDQVAQLVRFPSGPFLAPQGAFGFLEWRRFREQNHPCAAPAERGRPRLLILRLLPPRASPTAQTFKPPAGEQETAPRDRKSTRLNSSQYCATRMPSSA